MSTQIKFLVTLSSHSMFLLHEYLLPRFLLLCLLYFTSGELCLLAEYYGVYVALEIENFT